MVGSSGPLETATTLCGNTRAACAQRRRVRRQRMHAARSKPGGLMLARCEQELCLVVVTSQVKIAAANHLEAYVFTPHLPRRSGEDRAARVVQVTQPLAPSRCS